MQPNIQLWYNTYNHVNCNPHIRVLKCKLPVAPVYKIKNLNKEQREHLCFRGEGKQLGPMSSGTKAELSNVSVSEAIKSSFKQGRLMGKCAGGGRLSRATGEESNTQVRSEVVHHLERSPWLDPNSVA